MLPETPSELLNWLRPRLSAFQSSVAADIKPIATRKAAVLIGLVLHPQCVSVLLTRRADHLSTHAGQVSFPGGAIEETDIDAIAAAVRETEEEVGIAAHFIEPLCTLGEYHTISGFCVTPVLAILPPDLPLCPDVNEVAEVFELPLSIALDPSRYERRYVERAGVRVATHFLEHNGKVVWGATAGMLLQLSSNLGLEGIPLDCTR
ncbi:CoA pyrophosphatase [Chitinibacter sp. SCUT-21]|uniref:CoA pyrophosphatase n=1 Tax=Chitinibacter sp. SCUT-21 TaxID=2970891 RepID=UPI0035A5BCE4